jgi:NitT/TauT family transport system substrate-binding protein
MMRRMIGRLLGSFCVLFVMLLGCNKTEPTSKPADRVKLTIGYIPIAECAHLYVGIANGYFKDENLEISLQPMAGGAAILPAVQKGNLDVGFTNVVSMAVLNSRLAPRAPDSLISIVGATYERAGHVNHALLAKRDSPLRIDDLSRPSTRIALNTTRNVEELMLRRFLIAHKQDDSQLSIFPIPFPQMLPSLRRNDVDVVSVVEPFIEPAVRSGEFRVLAHQYLDLSPSTLVATYAVTRQWHAEHPDWANRLQRAVARADAFIKTNDAQMRQIIGSFTDIKPEDLSVIGMPAFEMRVDPAACSALLRDLQSLGFTSRPVSADECLP